MTTSDFGSYTVLRFDGVRFSKMNWQRPDDETLMINLHGAASQLRHELAGCLVYVGSDEVTLVIPDASLPYRGKPMKLVSVGAAVLAGNLSFLLERPLYFDGRIVHDGTDARTVHVEIHDRRRSVKRNAISDFAFHCLTQDGMTARQATSFLHGKTVAERLDVVQSCGYDLWSDYRPRVFGVINGPDVNFHVATFDTTNSFLASCVPLGAGVECEMHHHTTTESER